MTCSTCTSFISQASDDPTCGLHDDSQADTAAALELDALIKVPVKTPGRPSRETGAMDAGARLEAGSEEDQGDRLSDSDWVRSITASRSMPLRKVWKLSCSKAGSKQLQQACDATAMGDAVIVFSGSCSCLGGT